MYATGVQNRCSTLASAGIAVAGSDDSVSVNRDGCSEAGEPLSTSYMERVVPLPCSDIRTELGMGGGRPASCGKVDMTQGGEGIGRAENFSRTYEMGEDGAEKGERGGWRGGRR